MSLNIDYDDVFLMETQYYDHTVLENVDNIMTVLLEKIHRDEYREKDFDERLKTTINTTMKTEVHYIFENEIKTDRYKSCLFYIYLKSIRKLALYEDFKKFTRISYEVLKYMINYHIY